MSPYWSDDAVTLHHGDCIDVMRELPDNSVDSVVTDPPYGLEFMGKAWDAFKATGDNASGPQSDNWGKATKQTGAYAATMPRYTGKNGGSLLPFQQWCEQWATECLRVLKPGGHLLAFGGTRTWHRLAVAVEDAGFEIRDSIAWLSGSGFPKSLDVSKAIDKARDDGPARLAAGVWLRAQRESAGLQQKTVAAHWPSVTGGLTGCVANWEGGFSCPTWEQWLRLKEIVGFGSDMDAEVWRLNGRKGTPGEAWDQREVTGLHVAGLASGTSGVGGSGEGKDRRDAPATDAARQWSGWGTALKPAFEPCVVARKPLIGTVAANVTTHGTGALNIDGCRVGYSPDDPTLEWGTKFGGGKLNAKGEEYQTGSGTSGLSGIGQVTGTVNPAGRWPTNVVLDGSQAAALDAESGIMRDGVAVNRNKNPAAEKTKAVYGKRLNGDQEDVTYGGAGGASRFFPTFRYEAKAPTGERPRVDGVAHPTVKPLDLMRWLVRLVTPPGGTVLEPFAGSGTTAEACVHEHLRCIAIEREAEYLPLIIARLTKPMEIGFDFGDAA